MRFSNFKERKEVINLFGWDVKRLYKNKYLFFQKNLPEYLTTYITLYDKETIDKIADELLDDYMISGGKSYNITSLLYGYESVLYTSYIEDGGVETNNNITNYYATHNYDNGPIVREEEWL